MSPLTAYHSLLLSNLSTVQTIESALSNVTWFLPGRFEDAELASEGLYALLGLVSNYHDHILHTHIPQHLSLPPHPFIDPSKVPTIPPARTLNTGNRISPLLPAQSEHARYTRHWTNKSTTYKRASRALSTIGYLELVVEMLAKRKGGDRVRWRVVLVIELIKTFLRLTILRITKRPVLTPCTPQREIDPSSLPPEVLSSSSQEPVPRSDQTSSKLKSTPLTQLITSYAPLKDHLYPMLNNLPESHLTHPLNLINELKGKEYIPEVVWSSVGLIHVLLLMRSSRQQNASPYKPLSLPTLSRSYIPYLSILRLLLLARVLRPRHTSNLGMAHNASQDRKLLARAFLTGPMWLGFTRPKVLGLTRLLEKIPLVGLLGELVEGYLPLVDDYFYCGFAFSCISR
ncbi:hypothetical protein I302_107778 [Kwoniella bestiolae CBS 10118]|uniref:Peroxisomal membrane protein PEX16 n=1 Tax=Kwoniella bestiolae CBS 10118 TaxID=1296100 RepID=A0A1B9FXL2_9TREE|nr:peroxin-16 [Kwoniella bestiolae CBS 10118]OCF23501.1 peroxin-16 [Kwoniella bestiolae CBS 10118]